LARFINKSLNLWAKWLISGGKKAIGYTRKSCEIVKNRECFYSTQYYHLEEEFGKITLRDVKKFNENRFKDNLNFVTISYLSPRKNIEFAIKVLNNFPNIKLHIIGSGEKSYEDFLKSISKPNIIFHGYKVGEEKAKVLKEADFFIFTTKKDSWGFVINEAFYFGLPVISSDKAMAVFELLENKQNGFIYKNEDELKIIIDEVLNRKFDFKILSLNAKNKIENFNSRVIDNFIKFLS
jgi:glycosyltransferase involved in cell wall biosynthesis